MTEQHEKPEKPIPFASVRGRIATLGETAIIFGVAEQTVRRWAERGCPALQKSDGRKGGPGWKFATGDVHAWLVQQEKGQRTADGIDLDEAKRRKMAAEAELAELDAAERRGDLVRIDSVVGIVAEQYGACRAKLLAMPTKLAPLLASSSDMNEIRATLDQAIREALDELRYDEETREGDGGSGSGAGGEAPGGADGGTGGSAEAAAAADGQRVVGQLPQAIA